MERYARTLFLLGALLFVFALLGAFPSGLAAHEIRPAIVTISSPGSGQLEIEITTNLEALLAGIGPQHKDTDDSPDAATYAALRGLSPAELDKKFRDFLPMWLKGVNLSVEDRRAHLALMRLDIPAVGNTKLARISKVWLTTQTPSAAPAFTWGYAADYGSSVLRTRNGEGKTIAIGWLKDGAVSPIVSIEGVRSKGRVALFLEYATVGFTHILPKGLDHILFVLGLYFLSPGLRPLLTQVTAFTVAHSITLALGLYAIVKVSPAIVEPLIAASIVYVAVENLTTTKLTIWRPIIVFAFGLLHGLGFASVLQEIGLPRQDYALGLIAFNVGVEGGQLAVIALAWLATGLWFAHRSWYRQRIAWPASGVIAAIGLYWTVERVFLT